MVFDKQHVVKMMGKGVQAGSQLQEMRGEVGELPKPKQPVGGRVGELEVVLVGDDSAVGVAS